MGKGKYKNLIFWGCEDSIRKQWLTIVVMRTAVMRTIVLMRTMRVTMTQLMTILGRRAIRTRVTPLKVQATDVAMTGRRRSRAVTGLGLSKKWTGSIARGKGTLCLRGLWSPLMSTPRRGDHLCWIFFSF